MAEKRGSFGASVKYDPLGGTAWTTVVRGDIHNSPCHRRAKISMHREPLGFCMTFSATPQVHGALKPRSQAALFIGI